MLKEQELPIRPTETAANLQEAPLQRPVFWMDKAEKIINADGRVKRFPRKARVAWDVLLFLAGQSEPVSNTEVRGSSSEGNPLNAMTSLRKIIEKNPKDPKMLKRDGWRRTTTYRLNADVRFIDKSHPDWGKIFAIPKEEQKVLSGERQLKVISVFFALNEDKTAFREESRPALIKAIYSERFSGELDSEQIKKIFKQSSRNFLNQRNRLIEMLKKSETIPAEEWSPIMTELIGWLRAQPEYAKASVEDLILAVKREISFGELKRRTALSSDIPAPATAVGADSSPTVTVSMDGDLKETAKPTPYKLTPKELFLFLSLVFPSGVDNRNALNINFKKEQRVSIEETWKKLPKPVRGKGDVISSREFTFLRDKLKALIEEPEAFLRQNADKKRIVWGIFDTIICNISKNDWEKFLREVGFR